ncbi:MAG TPA: Uma2 family endonuclease [Planctomycetota bacterium]|nr:Uma2 family endonuclease [Planctomycetota bacterium]
MSIAQHRRETPPTDRLITAEEFADHPEWGPCELIRGKVVPLTNPKPVHGFLMYEISYRLGEFVRPRKTGQIFSGDAGIFIERGPDTVRGPDVGYISRERLTQQGSLQKYFNVAPELCVEIVSPTDRWSEITEKVDMFLAVGVTLVWVIDPKLRQAHVYRKGREVLLVKEAEALDGEDVLPGFKLPLQEVFAVAE